jgi:hypothetical protein
MCAEAKEQLVVFTVHILENIIIKGQLTTERQFFHVYFHSIYCSQHMKLFSTQDHFGVKMFLFMIFHGVHSCSTDNCFMGKFFRNA